MTAPRRRTPAAVLVLLLMLTGCSSAPRRPAGPRPPSWGEFIASEHSNPLPADGPQLRSARAAIVRASPGSLREAARLLSAPGTAADYRTRELQGLGRGVYALLYPELSDNPFPANARSLLYGRLLSRRGDQASLPDPQETDFMRITIPCLLLLGSGGEVPDAAVREALQRADETTGGTSVLPPYLLGLLAAQRGADARRGEPLASYRESVRRDPGFYPAAKAAAALLLSAGKPEEALPLLSAVAAALPRDPAALKDLAGAAFKARQYQRALDAAARAILLAPDDPAPALLRARAFDAAGNWYQAIRVLDALEERVPGSRDAVSLKAKILADSAGDREEALRILDRARAEAPSDAGLAELAGRILLDAGRPDQGLGALQHALQIEPGRLSTLRLLLSDSVRVKRWAQAQVYLSRIPAASRTGEDLLLAYTISWNLDDFVQAAAYGRLMMDGNAGGEARLLLARALHAAGNDAEAAPLVEAGLREEKSPEERSRLYTLRASLEKSRDTGASLDDLRLALRAMPDNLEALIAISDLLARRNEFRKAIGYLTHAAELAPEETGLQIQLRELVRQSEEE